jgi:transposase
MTKKKFRKNDPPPRPNQVFDDGDESYKPPTYTTGRPTKFKPEYCNMLIKHMSEGLSFKSFAGLVNVNLDTLYNWEQLFPEFSESKEIGLQKARYFWEVVGRQGAVGKIKGFNAASYCFNMKNRFKWSDRAPEDDSSTTIQTVRIELPDSKSEQVISVEPKKVGKGNDEKSEYYEP